VLAIALALSPPALGQVPLAITHDRIVGNGLPLTYALPTQLVVDRLRERLCGGSEQADVDGDVLTCMTITASPKPKDFFGALAHTAVAPFVADVTEYANIWARVTPQPGPQAALVVTLGVVLLRQKGDGNKDRVGDTRHFFDPVAHVKRIRSELGALKISASNPDKVALRDIR